MPTMTSSPNTNRFTGLADIYAAHRPSYPGPVIQALAKRCESAPSRLAIDIGCGTGISTAAVATQLSDWTVVAAEPNPDMLTKAREALKHLPNVDFAEAGAEGLPGAAASAGLVLAAQALHWFDKPAFFAEAARVLAPGGTFAVLYNNRQNAVSVVLQEIEAYFEGIDASYSRNYREQDIPAMLQGLDEFENVDRIREIWLKPTSADELVEYMMSRSMVQPLAAKVGLGKFRQRIGDIASEHARSGVIDIPFAAELDMATRL